MRDALERLREHFANAHNAEALRFCILASIEVVTVISVWILPPLGAAALLKYLFFP